MKLLWVLSFFLMLNPAEGKALKITIDPGHGGEDKGAVHAQVVEAKIALQISQKLFRKLNRDPGFQVQLLRNKDRNLSLEERVEQTERFQPDLFLSIHGNAHPTSKSVQGAEFYIQNQLPVDKEMSFLAHREFGQNHVQKPKISGDIDSILFDIKKSQRILKSYQISSYLRKNWTSKKKRMIRQGPFFVLTQNEVPAVLVEVGYLTHPRDRKRLQTSGHQHHIANQIHKALTDYAKNVDKLPSGILKPQNAKTR